MRGFRRRLLIFGYPVLELATAYLVAQLIGWGWMLLLIIAGIPAGFAVMRNAGEAAMRDAVQAQKSGKPIDASRHALGFVGGVLIAIPGFWTDLIGLLLVVPLTQRLIRAPARRWFETRFTAVRMPGIRYPGEGDVIQGTVIYPEDDEPPTRPELR
jgi:UPF0716 protein FxsA